MRYISQTIDFITYQNGKDGKGVASVVVQYHLSNDANTEPTEDVEVVIGEVTSLLGWTSDFETIWKCCKQYKYIWSREVTTYTDNSTPTISGARVDNASTVIAGWCSTNDMTLIDGANIAAGTIIAEHIDVDDLSALEADIGGWKIDDYHIRSADESVGLYSESIDGVDHSNNNNPSLLGTGELKSIRFYAGASNKDTLSSAPFKVLSDGSLYASAAKIEGDVTSNKGVIGGWKIDDNYIYSEDESVGLCSNNGTSIEHQSLCDLSLLNNALTPIRFYAGADDKDALYSAPFKVLSDGSLYASAAKIEGDVTAQSGTIGGWEIDENYISTPSASVGLCSIEQADGDSGLAEASLIDRSVQVVRFFAGAPSKDGLSSAPFKVLDDGSLFATNAQIEGDITANKGYIGNLEIASGGLVYNNNGTRSYSLNESGLILEKNTANIKVGDLTLGYDADEKSTIIETSGHLVIRGANATQLEFMKDSSDTIASSNITLYYEPSEHTNTATSAKLWATSIEAPLYPVTINVEWQNGNGVYSGTQSITIKAGNVKSNIAGLKIPYSNRVRFRISNQEWTDYVGSSNDVNTVYSFDNFTSFYHMNSPANLYLTGNLRPSIKSVGDSTGYDLGSGDYLWNTIYARNATIQTSDREAKKDIELLSDDYEKIFDALQPVSYKFKVNNNNRTHTGFIAPDVKTAIENAGLTTKEFAGYCEWEKDDGTLGCGLRYSEFIALCVNEIQKLKKRVAELESK